jgi:hypothetical protein
LLRDRAYQDFNQILAELLDAQARAERRLPKVHLQSKSQVKRSLPRCKRTTQTVNGRRQRTARYYPYPLPSLRESRNFPLLDSLDFQQQFDCLCSKIIWYVEELTHTVEQYLLTLQDAIAEVESFLT